MAHLNILILTFSSSLPTAPVPTIAAPVAPESPKAGNITLSSRHGYNLLN